MMNVRLRRWTNECTNSIVNPNLIHSQHACVAAFLFVWQGASRGNAHPGTPSRSIQQTIFPEQSSCPSLFFAGLFQHCLKGHPTVPTIRIATRIDTIVGTAQDGWHFNEQRMKRVGIAVGLGCYRQGLFVHLVGCYQIHIRMFPHASSQHRVRYSSCQWSRASPPRQGILYLRHVGWYRSNKFPCHGTLHHGPTAPIPSARQGVFGVHQIQRQVVTQKCGGRRPVVL